MTPVQERKRANRKYAVGQQITGGAMMAGGATVNEVLDGRLRRRGSAPTVSALIRSARGQAGGFSARTHIPHIAGKMGSRGLQLASLPLMAAGTKNLISGSDTKPVSLTRDVAKPVFHYATLQDEVARGQKQLNVKKLLGPDEQVKLSRQKRVGRDLSLVSGTLGLTALGLRAPQAAAALERRGVKGLSGLARHSKKATSASNTLGVGAIGIGSAGSFNYAAQQGLERKRDVAKAEGEYFRAPAPLERDSGRAQFRERTQPVSVSKEDANPAAVAAATAGGAFAGHMANFGGHYAFNELYVKPKFQRGRETWTRDQKKAWGRHVNNVPEGMTGEQYRTGKQFFRNFPKELPGSGARRTLGWTQKGKTGHAVAAASMATGALIANRAASRDHVKKGALSYVPKSRMLEDGVKGALILRDPGFLMPVAGVTTAGVTGGAVAARKRRRKVSKALPDKMFHAGRWRRVLSYDERTKQILLDNHSDPGMPYRVSRGGQKVPKPVQPTKYEQGELDFGKSFMDAHRDRVSPGAVKWWKQARHERNRSAVSAAGNASLAGLSGWMLHHELNKRPMSKPAVAITSATGLAAAYGSVRSGQKAARRQKSMKVVEQKARMRTAAGLYGPGRGLSPVDTTSHNYRKHEGVGR